MCGRGLVSRAVNQTRRHASNDIHTRTIHMWDVRCEIKLDTCRSELKFIQLCIPMNKTDFTDSNRTNTLCWHFYRTCLRIRISWMARVLIHRIYNGGVRVCHSLPFTEPAVTDIVHLTTNDMDANAVLTPIGNAHPPDVEAKTFLIRGGDLREQGSTFPLSHVLDVCRYVNGAHLLWQTYSISSEHGWPGGTYWLGIAVCV